MKKNNRVYEYIQYVDLKKLCTEWKKTLGLSHWRTKLEMVNEKDFDSEDRCLGMTTFGPNSEEALIQILNPHDYSGSLLYDMEKTLVHELCHLVFGCWTELDETKSGLHERAIDRMAITLVNLKRNNTVN